VPGPEHDRQQVRSATFLGPNWGGQGGVNRRDIAHKRDKIQSLPLPVQEALNGNMGCQVSERGIENYLEICPKINLLKRYFFSHEIPCE
jgi:hypothetical protein